MAGEADNQRFAEDKPGDCTCCYFWDNRKRSCTKETCYYLLPETGTGNDSRDCSVCPYGSHSPCIGYCLLKIIREMRLRI